MWAIGTKDDHLKWTWMAKTCIAQLRGCICQILTRGFKVWTAQNTVWKGLYANSGGYNRPPKAVFGSHLKVSPTSYRGVEPPDPLDKYSAAKLHYMDRHDKCWSRPYKHNRNSSHLDWVKSNIRLMNLKTIDDIHGLVLFYDICSDSFPLGINLLWHYY